MFFLAWVPDWLTKAAATKPPQEGDSPTPQPLADRQPSESLSLLKWVLRTMTEDEKRERERTNPLYSRRRTKVAANKLPKRCADRPPQPLAD